MTENHELKIEYMKYTSARSEGLTLRPYAVKEYAKRWYLIAYCIEREALRVYGLDRILNLEITDKVFKMPSGFDIDELFATSFGIYLPEGKGKHVIFKTSATEARFIRDLPLHRSQEEISNDGNSVTFSLFVCPDKNLIMEFCKYGSRIEVLSPEEIRKAVAEELATASKLYL